MKRFLESTMSAGCRWLLLVALVAALVVAPSAMQAAALPKPVGGTYPGANGKIAFVSNRDGNNEIYVMDSNGANQTNLTNNAADDREPAWSPDGSKIAFATDRDGNFEIYVMNADGTNPVRLTNNTIDDNWPTWSPDGSKIAFSRGKILVDAIIDLYVMNSDGTGQTNITNAPTSDIVYNTEPAWSPDGTKIAFSRLLFDNSAFNQGQIAVINPDGSGLTQLTNVDHQNGQPAWFPDGSRIVFSRGAGSLGSLTFRDLYVMNADGTNQTLLAGTSTVRLDNPAPSPDGTKLAYDLTTPGNPNNSDIFVDGSNLTSSSSVNDFDPDWQPLGSTVDCSLSSWSVSSETELNDAIACFNAKTTAGSYTITLTGNISLTASTTAINNSTAGVALVINGAGFIVNGQGTSGVRPFTIAANTTVTMNEITITGGNVPGTTGLGGGIENNGTLTINRSTISGNTAGHQGGGLINRSGATATLNNSTISGNSVQATGDDPVSGGGVTNIGTMVIDSTTIANNAVTALPTNGNGSGISALLFDSIEIRNSIVANNTGAADCYSSSLPMDDVHNSLIESTASGCDNAQGVNGNLVGVDPVLGPLANNGGSTQTHALLAGSPAIDAGDTTLTVDQRGVTRPQGTADDMGAVEVKALNGPGGSVVPISATTANNPTPQLCAATGTNLAIYTITQTLQNQSANALKDLFFRVKQLEYTTPQGGAVPSLCNATTVVNNGGVGSMLAVPNASLPGGNSQLDPSENLVQAFQVGRPVAAAFRIKVDLFSSTIVAAADQANELYLGTFELEVDADGQLIGQHALFLPLVVQ